MVAAYDFLSPPSIVFGWGRRREAGALAARLGRRALIVCGSRSLVACGLLTELLDNLRGAGVEATDVAHVAREPTVEDVDAAVEQLRAGEARAGESWEGRLVVALGGGSAIDLAKAVAALAVQPGRESVRNYLEGVGRGLALTRTPLPVLTLPTTAGTGSEATKNAVISSVEPPYKKSLRHEGMIPRAVLVDPEYTVGAGRDVTAHSGMDAITQLVESYISCRAKPIPQALALAGVTLALKALPQAVREPASRPAREAMAQAALLSGMALANSGLGMAHGVAAALGVVAGVPHGLACAVMLPLALRANRAVAEARLAELAWAAGLAAPGADQAAAADALLAGIDQLAAELGIPTRLGQLGVRGEQIPLLVRGARGNSMDGNPRPLPDEEIASILAAAL